MTPRHSDPDPLLTDIFSDERLENFRSASLEQTLALARRRRLRRRQNRGFVLLGLALAAIVTARVSTRHEPANPSGPTLALPRTTPPAPVAPATRPAPKKGGTLEFISDDELLALFPNRAVALVGRPGAQRLVFLDERRP